MISTIAHKWIAAFNDHDLAALLALYAADAIHFSPKLKVRQPFTNGYITGTDALKNWWKDAFERLPDLHYELKNLIFDQNQLLMEYERTVSGEPAMMIAEILEIEAGMIVRSRVYHS